MYNIAKFTELMDIYKYGHVATPTFAGSCLPMKKLQLFRVQINGGQESGETSVELLHAHCEICVRELIDQRNHAFSL